jgi:hypothetical protein
MNTRKAGFIALTIAAAIPISAFAGTYLESTAANKMSPQAPPRAMKMWVGDGRVRIEMMDGQQVQIFKDKAFYMLNVAAKSYSKLDKASLEALTRKNNESIQAMLPPDQRGKAKQSSTPKVERTVKPTGRTESSALGQPCKVWEVLVNGNKTQELCVVEVSTIANGKEMIATMQQVTDAFKGTPAGTGMMEVWQDVKTMNGFPVITRMYMNGKLFQEVKTTAVRAAATPDSLFVIPAGFKEQALGQAMGGIG